MASLECKKEDIQPCSQVTCLASVPPPYMWEGGWELWHPVVADVGALLGDTH